MNVCLWGVDEQIDPRNIGPHEEYVYSCGQCHALALAIHERTGWQLAVLCPSEDAIPSEDGDHVICITPDGLGVDIKGFRPLSEIQDQWAFTPCLVECGADTVWNLGWDEHDMEAARVVAETVLAWQPVAA